MGGLLPDGQNASRRPIELLRHVAGRVIGKPRLYLGGVGRLGRLAALYPLYAGVQVG